MVYSGWKLILFLVFGRMTSDLEVLSSVLLFQKKRCLKKTSHTLFWMRMMRMKSLTLTLNLDHKVSHFSISPSAFLLRLSFYEIP